MNKAFWTMLVAGLNLWMLAAPARAGFAEDDKLNKFFKSYLERYFRHQPVAATQLGDHRFDNLLDDISPKARAGWLKLAEETLRELPRQVDYSKLSRDGQIDFEIFRHNLRTQIWETKNLHPFQEDPRTYGAYLNDSVYLLLTQSTLPKETNISNCLARMAQMPRIVAEAEKTLTHPPKPILETAIRQNQGAIDFYQKDIFALVGETDLPANGTNAPHASPSPLEGERAGVRGQTIIQHRTSNIEHPTSNDFSAPSPSIPLPSEGRGKISSAQLNELKTAAAKTAALLEKYQKFLKGPLMARATGNWRLGRKKFDTKFELETDAGITAEQNLADAETEFNHVRRDMYVLARQLWCQYFPQKPLPPDDAAGSPRGIKPRMVSAVANQAIPRGERETILKVIDAIDQDHSKPDELVSDARADIERIKTFIRKRHYIQLPKPDRCEVIVMPEFRRGNSLAYLDNAPPLDPNAHSYYAISPPPSDWTPQQVESFLEEYNRYMLQILTIHEGYPGHYVQLSEAARVPSLIRRVYQSGVFIEGWAVYGEMAMLNEGYGDGDLRLRLMELKFYLRAVANSILDYKVHWTHVTDAEAMKFMTQDAFQSAGEAKLKLIRAKQSSVQLSTYFVGRMALYRLRQQIEREMGNQFSLERYHDAVISHGSIPVKYLPELVRADLGLVNR